MRARLLPTVVALGLALAALGVGLWSLQRIFGRERADAEAAVEARRLLLEQYALTSLAGTLAGRLEGSAADRAAAVADPLVGDDGLYLWREGAQALPRRWVHAPGDATPAEAVFRAARAGEGQPGEGPRAERAGLAAELVAALAAADDTAVERAMRGLLAHRARFRLDAAFDLPLTLGVLDRFLADGRPDPGLMRALLHDGLTDRQGTHLDGLHRALLARRDAFTAADFDFLARRVVAQSVVAGAPTDAFEARAGAAPAPALPFADVDTPSLVAGGAWYVAPQEGDARAGVAVGLPALLTELTAEMRGRGLLAPDDTVEAAPFERAAVRGVPLRVRSPTFAAARAQAARAWRAKTALNATCAAFALLLAGVALGAQARRQRFLELKSDFVSTVSHELRTPLASIRVMAETLERRLTDVPRARDYPTRIVQATDALGLMVENILSFNRIDKGRWVARRERVALAELLEAARAHAEAAAERPLDWRVEGAEGVHLEGDPELLTLLFQNLARNAARYNARDPIAIHVAVTAQGPLTVTVADNGLGVPADARRHVFTAFYRVPGRDARGSGLGLALCRRIMALHGGRIELTRTGPEGSLFTLRFGRTA